MNEVRSLASEIETRLRRAMTERLGADADVDPLVRRSDRADFQANGILPLGRTLQANPRELAGRAVDGLERGKLLSDVEVSGPGFVNMTVTDDAIMQQAADRYGDENLGIPRDRIGETAVIDYSQPNIAKEMHVGHLRTTIIGDALTRILGFLGAHVIRQNHLGDWGTQFGMLVQYLVEHPDTRWRHTDTSEADAAMSRLNELYRVSRVEFDSDPEFRERARNRVVALQSGDAETVGIWQQIVDESKLYFNAVYDKLDVLLTDEDAVGESFYNPYLDEVTRELEESGVAVVDQGALCVFFDDIRGPDGEQVPLIIRKSDGGYGYATTDMAAIRYRVNTLKANHLIYVVDARQSMHFRMVFETARRAGWLTDTVRADHVAYGTVLGPDGKPFKTRSGETVRLIHLIDEAIDRARQTVEEKSGPLPEDTLADTAHKVGVGALKYADLATSRTRDYVFDLDRMVSLNGNTGVYLQYAHARIASILRKLPDEAKGRYTPAPGVALEAAERALGLLLDEFAAAATESAQMLEPHRLCNYLFRLAQTFTDFYETCPVRQAPSREIQRNRVLLCRLTGETLKLGLGLMGIAAPERL